MMEGSISLVVALQEAMASETDRFVFLPSMPTMTSIIPQTLSSRVFVQTVFSAGATFSSIVQNSLHVFQRQSDLT